MIQNRHLMQPAKPFYYFNGFNSAILEDYSGSEKISAVADCAAQMGFRFKPVSISYRRAAAHCGEILSGMGNEVRDAVFCGSSMGGWFARILQLKLAELRPAVRSAAIGFNPAFDLRLHGHSLLGEQVNFVTGERYTWAEQHSTELADLENSVNYSLRLPFFVYIDKEDEVIDSELSASKHAGISQLKLFDGGCHSFDHYREALADFQLQYLK